MPFSFEKVYEKYATTYCKSYLGSPFFDSALDWAIGLAFSAKYAQTGDLLLARAYAAHLRHKILSDIMNGSPCVVCS